jgi:hypothetical protein
VLDSVPKEDAAEYPDPQFPKVTLKQIRWVH